MEISRKKNTSDTFHFIWVLLVSVLIKSFQRKGFVAALTRANNPLKASLIFRKNTTFSVELILQNSKTTQNGPGSTCRPWSKASKNPVNWPFLFIHLLKVWRWCWLVHRDSAKQHTEIRATCFYHLWEGQRHCCMACGLLFEEAPNTERDPARTALLCDQEFVLGKHLWGGFEKRFVF